MGELPFKQLTSVATGIANASTIRLVTARSIVPLTMSMVKFLGINILDLTAATVDLQLSNMELLIRGIRAADSLHVASAVNFDAEVFITVDEDLLKLDGVITNTSGNSIKFCDTDVAWTIL